MQLLDWLVIATVAAIVLVLLDGLRRKWVERRNRVVMKLDRNIPQEEIDLDLVPNSELPNGGARTLPRDADPFPGPRKRSAKLKDGREQRSSDASAAGSVPVLMDHVEVEEESIEHANVYVKVEEPAAGTHDAFSDDDLPQEVLAGLDNEFAEADAAAQQAAEDEDDEEQLDAEPVLEDLDDDDYEDEEDELTDPDLDEEFDDDDEGLLEPELEEAEQFEPELDDDEDDREDEDEDASTGIEEEDYQPVTRETLDDEDTVPYASNELDQNDERDIERHEERDDEEYADNEGEYPDDYENEPTLLEGAYRKAASHFQRPQEPQVPRVEPGFGEVSAGEEVDPAEDFSSAFDERLMDEILDEEQDEIRAWRAQSVTQRDVPAPEVPAEKPQPRGKSTPVIPEPQVAQTFIAPDDATASDDDFAAEPRPAGRIKEKNRESKKGFWEAVTGKAAAKPASKPVTPKINQGELFQEDLAEAEPAPEADPGPQEVIIINVMAKPGQYFRGDDLLPLVQRYGMRLGNMSIFHRHADHTALGPVMFSMANMVKPGTFTLSHIEEFVTPGVSFFVQLPNKFGNMKSFDQMLATAEGIKQTLGGDLKDERRSVFTRQTVEHCRQRIRDFELSLLAKK